MFAPIIAFDCHSFDISSDETTIVEYGLDEDNKYITTYFRKTFEVNDIEEIQSLTLCLLRDDGAVLMNFMNTSRILLINKYI